MSRAGRVAVVTGAARASVSPRPQALGFGRADVVVAIAGVVNAGFVNAGVANVGPFAASASASDSEARRGSSR
ncbi:hypothetical protein [Streptomyces bluensis]|uniref:hypothetical protein n=1 Tax=Streptomyces bluensis TaxID=33897 RepID=UPI003329F55B